MGETSGSCRHMVRRKPGVPGPGWLLMICRQGMCSTELPSVKVNIPANLHCCAKPEASHSKAQHRRRQCRRLWRRHGLTRGDVEVAVERERAVAVAVTGGVVDGRAVVKPDVGQAVAGACREGVLGMRGSGWVGCG